MIESAFFIWIWQRESFHYTCIKYLSIRKRVWKIGYPTYGQRYEELE